VRHLASAYVAEVRSGAGRTLDARIEKGFRRMDAGLKRELEAKVYAGERLNREDGIALLESDDLAWLGRLAHHKRTEMNGDRVMFAVNRHSDIADACSANCAYRAFSNKSGDTDELDWEVGRHVVDVDCEWEDWSRVHRLAHAGGRKSPATMLYGRDEEPEHRIDHIIRLRELQDETGGFAVFIPLRYQPADGTTAGAAPAETLKTFAVSRLMFDNVPHVQCLVGPHSPAIAQLALNFGADDLGGPVVEDKIDDDADGTMLRDDVLTLIGDASLRPVERDARYEVVREYDAAPSFADRRSEPQQVWA
jgi:2-iminoacetate synthase ThiH